MYVFSFPEARTVYVFRYYKCETMQYLYSLCGIRSVILPLHPPPPQLFSPTSIQYNVGEGFTAVTLKKIQVGCWEEKWAICYIVLFLLKIQEREFFTKNNKKRENSKIINAKFVHKGCPLFCLCGLYIYMYVKFQFDELVA